VKIIESENWSTYRSAWEACMQDYYWYKDNLVFDWNKNEELDEMEREFTNPERVFLEAHQEGEAVGVCGIRFSGKEAVLRRWEPVALEIANKRETEQALLEYGLNYLSERGVDRVKVLVKYPFNDRSIVNNLLEIYRNAEFERYEPDSVDLVVSLDNIPVQKQDRVNITIDTHLGMDSKNIADYVIRAYASTPEDREIHGHDASVSDYNTALTSFDSIRRGRLGPSPNEFWKVALVDNKPAGFIGAFIRESSFRPTTGVLGPLGVFPEYRRLGIGVYLISEQFKSMKDYGCVYTAVGTPAANRKAIAMYEKAGYKLNCYLMHLEKVF
jgi:ribosomal protein S18 acetylase RimI-like enzyme